MREIKKEIVLSIAAVLFDRVYRGVHQGASAYKNVDL